MYGKCVIFDMDNTLADAKEREAQYRQDPKGFFETDRSDFFAASRNDPMNRDIVDLLIMLYEDGWTILISTGRGEEYRDHTEWWLDNVAGVLGLVDKIYMRPLGDPHRSDDIIKMEHLEQMRDDGYDPTLVFDDRDRVVKAWRNAGLRCMQVQEGNF